MLLDVNDFYFRLPFYSKSDVVVDISFGFWYSSLFGKHFVVQYFVNLI